MKRKRLPPAAQNALAVLFALLVWQLAAMLLGQDLLLVSPVRVIVRLAVIWLEPGFWQAVWFSFGRITGGFLLGLLCGGALAVLAGRVKLAEVLLRPFVVTIKSVPVASFIVLSLIWLSSRSLSIFISFLMVFPIVYQNVLQGLKSTDGQLLEMARVYGMPWRARLLYIHIPHLKPFLLSACSLSLGMSWKAGVAAEVIGIPAGSIGERLYQSKVHLDTGELFAWTVIIVLLSVAFEKLVLFLLKKAYAGWERR